MWAQASTAHLLSLLLSPSQTRVGVGGTGLSSLPALLWRGPQALAGHSGLDHGLRSVFPVSSSGLEAPGRPGCYSGCSAEELKGTASGWAAVLFLLLLLLYLVMYCVVDIPWKPALFWGEEEEVNLVERGVGKRMDGRTGRGNFDRDVRYERRI